MENYSSAVLNKKTVVIIVSVLVVLFFIVVSALYFFSSNPKTPASVPAAPARNTASSQGGDTTRSSVPQPQVVPAPVFNAEKHVLQTTPPIPPQSITLYTFKNNYSLQEIQAFGQRLGLNTVAQSKENSDFYLVSQIQDMNTRGYMQFNKKTGEFIYKSFGAVLPDGTQTDANPIALGMNYVKKLGLDDGTVSCTNFYSVKGYEDSMVTVVCHRDWAKVGGIPIVSFPGVINVDENTPLTSLSLGKVDLRAPLDASIVATSNGSDGKVQADDFNSISFIVEKKTGRLLAINSNLRQLVQTQSQTASTLLSPLSALQRVQQNKAELTLVAPAGSGRVSWSSVYPQNKVMAKQATIKDFILAYLEKPSSLSQAALVPYYIVRGTAILDTGYTTKYVSLVPALQGKTIVDASQSGNSMGQVAGAQTTVIPAKDASQKQGTFNNIETPSLIPTIQVDDQQTPVCTGSSASKMKDANITLHIDGLGDVTLAFNGQHQFYIGTSSFPVTDRNQIETAFFDLVAKQYTINSAHYLNSHPNLQVNSLSADSLNKLFDNSGQSTLLSSNKPSCQSSNFPPSKDCNNVYGSASSGYTYDKSRIAQVRDAVINTFMNKSVATAVTEFSAQSNLFASSTLSEFYKVFLKFTGSRYDNLQGDCYISGVSPELFIYSQNQSVHTVTYPLDTTYTYPSTENNRLDVDVQPNGVLHVNNSSYEYLYYEYNQNVNLTTPKNGYVIPSNDYQRWITDTMASQVGLNSSETARLVTDVANIMRNVSTPYIKVSLANETEVNNKLPLNISTISQVRRVHMLLTPVKTNVQLTPQSFERISRNGSYAVEVGARLAN